MTMEQTEKEAGPPGCAGAYTRPVLKSGLATRDYIRPWELFFQLIVLKKRHHNSKVFNKFIQLKCMKFFVV